MMTSTQHKLAHNVRTAREQQGLGIVRFCEMAGISRPLLNQVESGRCNITLDKLQAIADALGLEAWELLK